jgi:aminoglycoside phosphotransferase (APT) family kinase protein
MVDHATTPGPAGGGSGAVPPIPGRAAPELFDLIRNLARSVKQRLAPAATDRYLQAELYSLASVLDILGQEGQQLASHSAEERADLLRCLGVGGSDPDRAALEALDLDALDLDALRARLAAVPRDHPRDPAVRDFLASDLQRPLLGVVGIDLGAVPHDPAARAVAPPLPSRDDVADRLGAWLRRVRPGTEIVRIDRTTEGYGADTIICHLRTGSEDHALVVRIQWPELPLSAMLQPVTVQGRVCRALGAAGVPVAPVLAIVDETETLGAPFVVHGFVDGFVPTTWTKEGRAFTEMLARDHAREFIDTYAAIHAVDWRGAGLGDLLLSEDRVTHHRRRVDHWEAVYRDSELRPDPLNEEIFALLRSELRVWGELVLVHGDLRPGNIIYRPEGPIRAVIDFDLSGVNDFHEELGHAMAWPWRDRLGRACGLLEPSAFIAAYEDASGRSVVPEAVRFYELQAAFRRYLGFLGLARAWIDRGGDVRMARAWLAARTDRIELGKLIDRL